MNRSHLIWAVFVAAWATGVACIEDGYDPLHGDRQQKTPPRMSESLLWLSDPERVPDARSPSGGSMLLLH